MVRRGQDTFGAESLSGGGDLLVVGGDDYLLRQLRQAGPLVCVLDEEFSRIFGENFTGEPGGAKTCRNNSYNVHFIQPLFYKVSLPGKLYAFRDLNRHDVCATTKFQLGTYLNRKTLVCQPGPSEIFVFTQVVEEIRTQHVEKVVFAAV